MIDLTYPLALVTARASFAAMNLQFDTSSGDYIPRKGGAVIACNHMSYVDFIFVGLAARRSKRLVRFMAKKSTFDNPVSGTIMRSLHHVPVDRSAGAGAYAEAVRFLRSGELVGVYPEATISQSYELKDFKSGAARMAAEADVPLVPTIVFGAHRMFTKGRPRNLERGVAVSIYVGEPLHPTPDDDPTEVTAQLRTSMAELYERMIERYPQAPDETEAADTWWWPARLGGGAPTPEEVAARRSQD